jgi:hypothetical protein
MTARTLVLQAITSKKNIPSPNKLGTREAQRRRRNKTSVEDLAGSRQHISKTLTRLIVEPKDPPETLKLLLLARAPHNDLLARLRIDGGPG